MHPVGGAPDQTLVLPGQTMAFIDTPIYARASGYVKSWNYDIGAHVKRGDVLAEIETPELDQQLREAQAQLAQNQAAVTQAEANMDLAKVTSGRTSELVRQGWTSRQQGDQDRLTYAGSTAAVDVARANVRVAQAQVDRLEKLTAFERVTAPFDGVITARNTDVGALINAGAGSPATEMFHMASTRTLRIFVAAPETDAPDLHPGDTATVTFDEFPGQAFHGTLARTDGAINPASRTLLVEVDVDNSDGKLLPGAYAFVHFTLQKRTHSVVIPANTLLFRSEGLRVAVVRNERRGAHADHHRARLWRPRRGADRPRHGGRSDRQPVGFAGKRRGGAPGQPQGRRGGLPRQPFTTLKQARFPQVRDVRAMLQAAGIGRHGCAGELQN